MNLTERAQKVLAEIREKRTLADAATKGKWRVADDVGVEQADDFRVICRGTRANDEAFIADARTSCPLALDMLETAIEGLLPAIAAASPLMEEHLSTCLTTLCDKWEVGR